MHRSNGGTVVQSTAEEKTKWRDGIEAYYAEVLAQSSPEGLKFWDELNAARVECGQ